MLLLESPFKWLALWRDWESVSGILPFSLHIGGQVGLRVRDKPLPTLPSCSLSSAGSEIQKPLIHFTG